MNKREDRKEIKKVDLEKHERIKRKTFKIGFTVVTTAMISALAYFVLIGVMFSLYGEMRFDMFVSVYYAFVGACFVATYYGYDESIYDEAE